MYLTFLLLHLDLELWLEDFSLHPGYIGINTYFHLLCIWFHFVIFRSLIYWGFSLT